jgi:hypothetical protein
MALFDVASWIEQVEQPGKVTLDDEVAWFE